MLGLQVVLRLVLQKVYLPAGQFMQCWHALIQDATSECRLDFPPVLQSEHLLFVTAALRLSWQSLL